MRPLSDDECRVLDVMLALDFQGAPELRAQVDSARVSKGCDCGCPSVDLVVQSDAPLATVTTRTPVNAEVDGVIGGGLIVFVDEGRLSRLEYYSAEDEKPSMFPRAGADSSIRVTAPKRRFPAVESARLGHDQRVRSPDEMTLACGTCGRLLDAHNRHVRFRLPDPVLAALDQERTEGTWLSHADANQSVMMMVPTVGTFVRSLLPVRLTGGHTVTFGVWIGVHPDDMQRAFATWWEPEYVNLRLEGRLANAVPGWGLLAAELDVAVLNANETPYVVNSSEPTLARVLGNEWPHDEVLAGLP